MAYSTQVVDEEKTINEFWQQVAWRAPGIQQGTTLYVNYPGVDYGINNDAVNGPANFIYFPEQTKQIPVTYQLYALPQISATTFEVLTGKNKSEGYRTHTGAVNLDHLLVMSQPSTPACVHIIDARWPLFSSSDPDQVLVIGGYSKIDSILPGQESPKLAPFIFGVEPAHQWCYYFEKAELAVQTGDWKKVEDLGNESAKQGLHAEDPVEWIPFLQAYANLGEVQSFNGTAHRINGDPYAKNEACQTLNHMQNSGYPFSPAIQTQVDGLLCH